MSYMQIITYFQRNTVWWAAAMPLIVLEWARDEYDEDWIAEATYV